MDDEHADSERCELHKLARQRREELTYRKVYKHLAELRLYIQTMVYIEYIWYISIV